MNYFYSGLLIADIESVALFLSFFAFAPNKALDVIDYFLFNKVLLNLF